MIIAQRVTKKVGHKTILQDINLSIKSGEFVVVFGPNGAGKTTLLKTLSLLTGTTTGELFINKISAQKLPLKIRHKIGVISHQTFLYDHLTAYENLYFYGQLYGVPYLKKRIFQVLKEVGLEFTLNDPIRTFSRGMQQRLAIARAILHQPDILFLDEPYTGLDHHAINILNGVLAGLDLEGKTIFMITHNFEQGLNFSDRVFIMDKGQIVFQGQASDFNVETLKKTYLTYVEKKQ